MIRRDFEKSMCAAKFAAKSVVLQQKFTVKSVKMKQKFAVIFVIGLSAKEVLRYEICI